MVEEVLYILHLSRNTHIIKWFYVAETKLKCIFSVLLDVFQAHRVSYEVFLNLTCLLDHMNTETTQVVLPRNFHQGSSTTCEVLSSCCLVHSFSENFQLSVGLPDPCQQGTVPVSCHS